MVPFCNKPVTKFVTHYMKRLRLLRDKLNTMPGTTDDMEQAGQNE